MRDTKEVTTGVVTTISDSDLVMVAGSGGWKPISFANLMNAVRGGISVGGRNLLTGTGDFSGWNPKGAPSSALKTEGLFKVYQSSEQWKGYMTSVILEQGCEYTLSCYTNNPDLCSLNINYKAPQSGILSVAECLTTSGAKSQKIGEGVYRRYYTARCTKSGLAYILIENNSTSLFRFYCAKLERGNIATDWTPAPEDIASGVWGG